MRDTSVTFPSQPHAGGVDYIMVVVTTEELPDGGERRAFCLSTPAGEDYYVKAAHTPGVHVILLPGTANACRLHGVGSGSGFRVSFQLRLVLKGSQWVSAKKLKEQLETSASATARNICLI